MKKKSLLAIMLIALVLTLGLVVSCQPDPDPDAFAGTWEGTDGSGDKYKLVCDGFGSIEYTIEELGEEPETYKGTYSSDGTYVTLSYQEPYDEGTAYLYCHLITASDIVDYSLPPALEGKYAFHKEATSTACAFPANYGDDKYFGFTKDGNKYSGSINLSSTIVMGQDMDLSIPTAKVAMSLYVYESAYDPENVPALKCSTTQSMTFKNTAGGMEDPWNYKLEDCAVVGYSLRTKYTLTSTTLTISDDEGNELVLTKK